MERQEQTPSFMADLPLVREAYRYAREMRRSQRRVSDAAPFILHPLEVASLLHNVGHSESVVAAGILHDTVEATPVSRQELRDRFGPECLTWSRH
jgi:guanosine-3',5'-bis(diphosphate) 3'-pyrophosphohydrolase